MYWWSEPNYPSFSSSNLYSAFELVSLRNCASASATELAYFQHSTQPRNPSSENSDCLLIQNKYWILLSNAKLSPISHILCIVIMECTSPAIEVVTLLWHPVVRQINYIRNVGDNMKELERKTDELASLENDVRDKVTGAKWKAKRPMAVVNDWLKNVKEMKDEASEIKKEFEENRTCLMGCVPNCCSQRKIGKRTLKLIEEVNELNKKGSFEDVVIASPPPTTSQVMPTTALVGSTAEQNFNLIWNLLMEENGGIIGIYGMGGVGKTTVMKKINNQLESTTKFDIVIWVTVSKDFNLKRLQSAIAERLKLHKDLDEESLSIQLHEALRGKKFLLILDDVWDRISLEQVGIPNPCVNNGCKLVLTTRSHRVCQSMETNKVIKIKELSEEEAWLLFKEKVEATALVDSDVEVVAKQVANECKGLPLAIITIGRALRGVNDVGQWRHALKQLQNSKPEVGDMEDEVFGRLHFSYQKLKSEKLQTCFLYCSLFPEDYVIQELILIELWICEGLIEDDGDKQAMVDEGQSILNELVEACMLEKDFRYVKMHDLMRDMGIGITRKSPIFIVKAGIRLEKVVANKEWGEDVERISLMRNKIKMLSGEPPKCPKLLTLFLNENPISHFESHSFFQHMNQLRVLNLSKTEIEELPESVSSLENLHMLNLGDCKVLKRVPSLAKLKNLRCLDLSYTCIEGLPEGMEELVELRLLNLEYTKRLRWFLIEMLPRLSLLEVFKMKGSSFLPSSSSNEGERIERRIWFEEVTRLTRLVDVSFDFDFAEFSSFRKYAASIVELLSKIETFEFRVAKSITHKSNGDFIMFLCRMYRDQLTMLIMSDEEEDMKTRIPQFLLDFGFMELVDLMRDFLIEMTECKGMEWLHVARDFDHLLLSKVTYLYLHNMPDLRTLQKGALLHGTMANLQTLFISRCPKLKNLFSFGILQSLQSLESVDILNCIAMEEVVAGEEDENSGFNTDVTLPNLKLITLIGLGELQSICSRTMVCSSLRNIEIISCCKLKKIPLIIDKPCDDLKGKLKGTKEWWDALDWANLTHTKDLLKSFFHEE